MISIVYGCANIVPPSGGKKDTTPPVLLSIIPADSGLNIRPTRIELRFDKFMEVKDLEKNIQLSPILPTTPMVMSNGRKVTITIPDSQLVANTTYRIGLGDALTDNRENTPYKNFVYVFSTGAYFDSLELHGRVIDAETGLRDSAILVVLYPKEDADTAVMRKKPQYATRIDASGNFSFRSLPKRAFSMYAIQDLNNNSIYDYGEEKVGFLDATVTPTLDKDSLYTFYTFREVRDTTHPIKPADSTHTDTTARTASGKPVIGTGKPAGAALSRLSKTNVGYKVNADTSDLNKRTFDITQPLVINLTTYVAAMDSAKVYLSYENNGIEVEAIQQLKEDSGKIRISTQWYGDRIYTLRLVKGWAKDSSGNELPPGKYRFRTKGDQDYSTLIVHLGKRYQNDSLVLSVYKGTADSVYRRPVTDSTVTIKLLQPGNYGMRLIIDANRNGKWDPGVLLKKQQPEKILNYNGNIVLKAGWDNEVDFDEKTTGSIGSGKPSMNQPATALPATGQQAPPEEEK